MPTNRCGSNTPHQTIQSRQNATRVTKCAPGSLQAGWTTLNTTCTTSPLRLSRVTPPQVKAVKVWVVYQMPIWASKSFGSVQITLNKLWWEDSSWWLSPSFTSSFMLLKCAAACLRSTRNKSLPNSIICATCCSCWYCLMIPGTLSRFTSLASQSSAYQCIKRPYSYLFCLSFGL